MACLRGAFTNKDWFWRYLEVRRSFNTTTVREQHPTSHHKGATNRVQTGDRRYLVLCHCQLELGPIRRWNPGCADAHANCGPGCFHAADGGAFFVARCSRKVLFKNLLRTPAKNTGFFLRIGRQTVLFCFLSVCCFVCFTQQNVFPILKVM